MNLRKALGVWVLVLALVEVAQASQASPFSFWASVLSLVGKRIGQGITKVPSN